MMLRRTTFLRRSAGHLVYDSDMIHHRDDRISCLSRLSVFCRSIFLWDEVRKSHDACGLI